MNIYRNFTPSQPFCGIQSAVTLGTFDGAHIGHMQILNRVVEHARKNGEQAVVVTFDTHPISVLNPEVSPGMITTLDEKIELFSKAGIDSTFILTFTKQIASMSAELFIKEYFIDCLGMTCFIVGYDHGFGKDRKASTKELREYAHRLNFCLEIVKPVMRGGTVVKSSIIRSQILEGKVGTAAKLLGRDYSFKGKVIHDRGIGKNIGIPTANLLKEDPEKILPLSGVYAGWVEFEGKKLHAVISIGPRPTFNSSEEAIEVHIPGYNGDLYGQYLNVGFSDRLREIRKFDSGESLVEQIKKDIEISIKSPIK
ncbi:MAG: bifunctional riboflavin kinase/FAD synthetase [Candidatus Latescibacterota bacterium]